MTEHTSSSQVYRVRPLQCNPILLKHTQHTKNPTLTNISLPVITIVSNLIGSSSTAATTTPGGHGQPTSPSGQGHRLRPRARLLPPNGEVTLPRGKFRRLPDQNGLDLDGRGAAAPLRQSPQTGHRGQGLPEGGPRLVVAAGGARRAGRAGAAGPVVAKTHFPTSAALLLGQLNVCTLIRWRENT